MEFRDYAAKETEALFNRLLASQAEASLQHLRTLRDALDAATRGLEGGATGATQTDQDIQEVVRRLNTAAGAAARAAAQKVQKELQTLLDAANGELATARSENASLSVTVADVQAEADTLRADLTNVRADLKKETERAEAADRDLDAAIEAHAHVDAARLEAEAERRKLTAAAGDLERELADTRGLLDATVAEAARVSGELESVRREHDDLSDQLSASRAAVEQAQEEASASLEAAQGELRAEREQAERLSESLAEAETRIAVLRADLAEAQAQAEVVRTELQKETDRAEAADRDLDSAIEAHALVDAQRVEAEAEARKHAQSRAAAEKDLAEVRALLDAAVAQSARLGMQLDANAAEVQTLTADLSAAQAELDAARTQREAITGQLQASRARVQTLERNQAAHAEQVKQLEARLQEALQAEAGAHAHAASTDAETAQALADTSALRLENDRLGSLLETSARAVDELSSVSTISDLLAALVKSLAGEFSRVALFRVKANRLEGEHQVGFDLTTDITKLVIPLSVDSFLTRAASSGNIEHVTGEELADSNRVPFGGEPTAAIALPIVFQGETFATLYADSDLPLSERTPAGQEASAKFATLLVRTTAVLLTRLSQELKTLNELREYAAMLLQEAEEMYSADTQAGKNEDERRARLKDTIECARQLYAQRATLEGPAAASLFDERIGAALEGDGDTPFARDLGVIAGGTERKKKSKRSAAS